MLGHVILDLFFWFTGVNLLWPFSGIMGWREVNLWSWLTLPAVAGNPDLIGVLADTSLPGPFLAAAGPKGVFTYVHPAPELPGVPLGDFTPAGKNQAFPAPILADIAETGSRCLHWAAETDYFPFDVQFPGAQLIRPEHVAELVAHGGIMPDDREMRAQTTREGDEKEDRQENDPGSLFFKKRERVFSAPPHPGYSPGDEKDRGQEKGEGGKQVVRGKSAEESRTD
jgi:hypothetical protein